jgi:hypothetical protein
LFKQEEFMELIRRLGSSMRVITLDSLLLGTNTRTGKPDHMINIGKMVTYNQQLPLHALAALHIIRRVAAAPSTQNQLLALYTNRQIPGFKTGLHSSGFQLGVTGDNVIFYAPQPFDMDS